jgi:hypothetical protein
VRTALRGWVGFVESAAFDWLRNGDLPQDELRSMLMDMGQRALAWARAPGRRCAVAEQT